MDMLISDSASAEISKRVQDILRAFAIQDWQYLTTPTEDGVQSFRAFCCFVKRIQTSGLTPMHDVPSPSVLLLR